MAQESVTEVYDANSEELFNELENINNPAMYPSEQERRAALNKIGHRYKKVIDTYKDEPLAAIKAVHKYSPHDNEAAIESLLQLAEALFMMEQAQHPKGTAAFLRENCKKFIKYTVAFIALANNKLKKGLDPFEGLKSFNHNTTSYLSNLVIAAKDNNELLSIYLDFIENQGERLNQLIEKYVLGNFKRKNAKSKQEGDIDPIKQQQKIAIEAINFFIFNICSEVVTLENKDDSGIFGDSSTNKVKKDATPEEILQKNTRRNNLNKKANGVMVRFTPEENHTAKAVAKKIRDSPPSANIPHQNNKMTLCNFLDSFTEADKLDHEEQLKQHPEIEAIISEVLLIERATGKPLRLSKAEIDFLNKLTLEELRNRHTERNSKYQRVARALGFADSYVMSLAPSLSNRDAMIRIEINKDLSNKEQQIALTPLNYTGLAGMCLESQRSSISNPSSLQETMVLYPASDLHTAIPEPQCSTSHAKKFISLAEAVTVLRDCKYLNPETPDSSDMKSFLMMLLRYTKIQYLKLNDELTDLLSISVELADHIEVINLFARTLSVLRSMTLLQRSMYHIMQHNSMVEKAMEAAEKPKQTTGLFGALRRTASKPTLQQSRAVVRGRFRHHHGSSTNLRRRNRGMPPRPSSANGTGGALLAAKVASFTSLSSLLSSSTAEKDSKPVAAMSVRDNPRPPFDHEITKVILTRKSLEKIFINVDRFTLGDLETLYNKMATDNPLFKCGLVFLMQLGQHLIATRNAPVVPPQKSQQRGRSLLRSAGSHHTFSLFSKAAEQDNVSSSILRALKILKLYVSPEICPCGSTGAKGRGYTVAMQITKIIDELVRRRNDASETTIPPQKLKKLKVLFSENESIIAKKLQLNAKEFSERLAQLNDIREAIQNRSAGVKRDHRSYFDNMDLTILEFSIVLLSTIDSPDAGLLNNLHDAVTRMLKARIETRTSVAAIEVELVYPCFETLLLSAPNHYSDTKKGALPHVMEQILEALGKSTSEYFQALSQVIGMLYKEYKLDDSADDSLALRSWAAATAMPRPLAAVPGAHRQKNDHRRVALTLGQARS